MGKRGMRSEIGVIDDYARVSPDIVQEILDEVVANINRNAANPVFFGPHSCQRRDYRCNTKDFGW